jgi:hypothetical protein
MGKVNGIVEIYVNKEEFHRIDRDGEQHIGRRVLHHYELDTGECVSTRGIIIGYITPVDVDSYGKPAFVNPLTKHPAYLFEVECDDGLTRDLEELELEYVNDEYSDTDDDIDDRDYTYTARLRRGI